MTVGVVDVEIFTFSSKLNMVFLTSTLKSHFYQTSKILIIASFQKKIITFVINVNKIPILLCQSKNHRSRPLPLHGISNYHYQYLKSANFISILSIKIQDLSLPSTLSMHFRLEGLHFVNINSCYHRQSIHDHFLFKLIKLVLNVFSKHNP